MPESDSASGCKSGASTGFATRAGIPLPSPRLTLRTRNQVHVLDNNRSENLQKAHDPQKPDQSVCPEIQYHNRVPVPPHGLDAGMLEPETVLPKSLSMYEL